MNNQIVIENLAFSYSNDKNIIQNATFTISRGEFVAIIGPNGGGKTTLLKLLAGLYSPQKGTISIFGKNPKQHTCKIAYVPQALSFDRAFPITTLEVVLGGLLAELSFWGHYTKNQTDRALTALEQVAMREFAEVSFSNLSLGQIQRVLIARALVQEPELILFDEPTASVDMETEIALFELIKHIRSRATQKPLTILMVTHDIRAIIDHVERILCVQGVVASYAPNELCEHFALGLYHFPLIQTHDFHLPIQSFAKTKF